MALAQVERRHSTSSNGRGSAKADSQRSHREIENSERHQELLQAAGLFDGAIRWDVVIPLRSTLATTEVPNGTVNDAGQVRGSATTSRKGVRRGMPLFILAVAVSAGALVLLITPGDYVGEIKGIITASSVYVIYWLTQRGRRKAKEDAQQHRTSEEVFKFSTDKEKRLEERESRLRQEERDFMHGQIKLSRQRGHILARGYMALEFANDQLIDLLRDHQVDVPPTLLTQRVRAEVLSELKEVEDEQAATTESYQQGRS